MKKPDLKQAEADVENSMSEFERAVDELSSSWSAASQNLSGLASSAGAIADRLGNRATFTTWASIFVSGLIAGYMISRARSSAYHPSQAPTRVHPPHGATDEMGGRISPVDSVI